MFVRWYQFFNAKQALWGRAGVLSKNQLVQEFGLLLHCLFHVHIDKAQRSRSIVDDPIGANKEDVPVQRPVRLELFCIPLLAVLLFPKSHGLPTHGSIVFGLVTFGQDDPAVFDHAVELERDRAIFIVDDFFERSFLFHCLRRPFFHRYFFDARLSRR